jgi:dienelactone hydrolase
VSMDAEGNGLVGDGGQALEVNQSGHAVPAVLWRPRLEVRPPVVLLAHGGSGYKTDEFILRMARLLLKRGIAVLAIDAPFHGDRSLPDGGQRSYLDHMARQGMTEVCEEACADWSGLRLWMSPTAMLSTRPE